jgi:tetratricopeptide (TPR) repeat protein/CHAT domain-containing protein
VNEEGHTMNYKLESGLKVILVMVLVFALFPSHTFSSENEATIENLKSEIELNPANPELHTQLGIHYQNANELEAALSHYSKATSISPDYAEAFWRAGHVLRLMGKEEEGAVQINKSLEINPNQFEPYVFLGEGLMKSGKWGKALESYQKSLELNPDYIDAHRTIGGIYEVLEKTSLANKEFEIYLELNSNAPAAYIQVANTYRALNNFERQITTYNKGLRLNNNDPDILFSLAETLRQNRRFKQAVNEYKKLLPTFPSNYLIRFGLASAYLGIEEYEISKQEILVALKINDNNYQAYQLLGLINEGDGNYIEAVKAYKKSLELHPKNPESYLYLGMSYASLNKFDEAIDAFNKSIAIQPNQEATLHQLANNYFTIKKYEQAENAYKRVIALNPNNVRAHSALGFLYKLEGKYDEALSEYSEVLRIDPQDFMTKYKIAQIHNNNGGHKKAYDELKVITSLHPDNIEILEEIGFSLLRMGRLEEAAEIYEKVAELNPDNDGVFYSLGGVYKDLKMLGKSIKSLKKAIELNPKNTFARFSLAGTYQDNGESEKAIKEYHELIKIDPNDEETYYQLGFLYRFKNDIDNSVKYYKKAISLRPKDPSFHQSIADLYTLLHQFSNAKYHFDISLDLDPNYFRSHTGLGILYENSGKLNEAIDSHSKALQILEIDTSKYQFEYPYALEKMAEAHAALRNFSEAEKYYDKAINFNRNLFGNKSYQALERYVGLGLFYAKFQKYNKAITLLSDAEILSSGLTANHREVRANILNTLGMVHNILGNYDRAESYYVDSISIKESLSGSAQADLGSSYMSLGLLYVMINSKDKAEDYFRKNLTFSKIKYGDFSLQYADALLFMAFVNGSKDNHNKQIELSEEVMQIYEKHNQTSSTSYLKALFNVASGSIGLGKFDRANRIAENLLENQSADVRGSANFILAHTNITQKKFGPAEKYLEAALKNTKDFIGSDHAGYATELMNLAGLIARRGEYKNAWAKANTARDIIASQINRVFNFASEQDKYKYLATLNADGYVSIGLKLIDQEGVAENLFKVVLNFKNIVMDSLISQNEIIKNNPEIKPLNKRLTGLKQRYASLKIRNSFFKGGASSSQQLDQEGNFNELSKNIDALENAITRVSKKSESSVAINEIDMLSLQSALPKGSVLVEYAKFNITLFNENSEPKTKYLAFVLNDSDINPLSVVILDDAVLIDSAILEFRKSIQAKRDEAVVKKFGNKLYRLLIEPLLPQINNPDHIFISPDSDISFLPFDALVDDGGEYLISKFKFSYLNNGKDIIRFDGRNSNHNQKVILVGNPSFDNFAYTIPPDPTVQNQDIPKTRSADYKKLSFGSLPGTKHEVDTIGRILKNVEHVIYANEKANELNIKSISSPWILHIATHGFFLGNKSPDKSVSSNRGFSIVPLTQAALSPNSTIDINNPLFSSGLALAGANKFLQDGIGKNGDDGLLVAMEVLGMNLTNTDLVVLSACNTGIGEVKRGHGVFGLRRSFQQAGAKSLVMSLWQIPDEETKDLMVEFYQRLYDGHSKLNALHEASLSVMKSARDKYKSTHPFYWSGFILIGDPGSN